MEEVKVPKRKYVRKDTVKSVTISEPEQVPDIEELVPIKPKRKYTRKEKIIVESKEESKVPNEDLVISKIKEVFIKPYSSVQVYIYYEGHRIDTLVYIKEFQSILDSHNLGSQVVVVSYRVLESVGLRNCFKSESPYTKWTDPSLSESPVLAIRIKERPVISPSELFELIKVKTEHEDAFLEIYEY